MHRIILISMLLLLPLPVASARAVQPGLVIVEPANGETIIGSTVTVRIETTNFEIVPSSIGLAEYGQRPDVNRRGEGHAHLILNFQPLVVLDQGTTYTFANVPPGEHQLKVELANNDHASLLNPVIQIIRFRTVADPTAPPTTERAPEPPTGPEPVLTIIEPANGTIISGDRVTVRINTENFEIAPSSIGLAEYGQRPDVNVIGQGHVHLALDLLPLVVLDQGTTYTFENVPPGDHQLRIELANNDHAPLYTPVIQSIRFRTIAEATTDPAPAAAAAPAAETARLPQTSASSNTFIVLGVSILIMLVIMVGGFILRSLSQYTLFTESIALQLRDMYTIARDKRTPTSTEKADDEELQR